MVQSSLPPRVTERYAGKYFAPTKDRQKQADEIATWLTDLHSAVNEKGWFVGEWQSIQFPDGGCILIAYTFEQ